MPAVKLKTFAYGVQAVFEIIHVVLKQKRFTESFSEMNKK